MPTVPPVLCTFARPSGASCSRRVTGVRVSIIAARCRQCNAEGEADCAIKDCTLYPVRPMQPGGRPRPPRSEAQREADKAAGLRLAAQKLSRNPCYLGE